MLNSFLVPGDSTADRYQLIETVDDVAGEPLLAAFFAYWKQLCGDRPMPAAGDLDALEMPRRVLPYVGLFDVVGPAESPRFRVRLMGTQLTDKAAQDYTGKFVDEVAGGEGVQHRLAQALKHRRPYYAETRLTWSRRSYKRYQVVACPLADEADPNRIGRLVALVVID